MDIKEMISPIRCIGPEADARARSRLFPNETNATNKTNSQSNHHTHGEKTCCEKKQQRRRER